MIEFRFVLRTCVESDEVVKTIFSRACAVAALVTVAAVAMFGCARKDGPFEQWIKADDPTLWTAARSASELQNDTASATAAGHASFDQDTGPEIYVQTALARNPSIRAARQNAAAMAQRIPQVTSLSDPMFEVAPIGSMAETAAGSVSTMTGVSQRFPLGGKLSAAGDVAEAEVAQALAKLSERELEVAADVRRAYWSYYEAARGLEVISRSRDSLDQLSRAAESQYKAGQAAQQDVLRASVELGELDATIATLEQRRDSAKAMLNQLMDYPVDADLPVPMPASLTASALELSALIQTAAKKNPVLQRLSSEIDADRHRVRLAKLQRVPDLNVSFSYNFVDDEGLSPVANGDDQWWIGFGINLPIWNDRLEAAEREGRLNVLRGASDLAQQRNVIAFRVQDSLLAAASAHRRATLFHDVILPQARQTVDASLSGYRAGNVNFLTVTDNWRRSLEFELMYHESIAQFQRALADLEQTVGTQIEEDVDGARVDIDESNGVAP